jgi:hypothetical protein
MNIPHPQGHDAAAAVAALAELKADPLAYEELAEMIEEGWQVPPAQLGPPPDPKHTKAVQDLIRQLVLARQAKPEKPAGEAAPGEADRGFDKQP